MFIYGALVLFVTIAVLGLSMLIPADRSAPAKFMPYESGILTQTRLLEESFPMRHYLVALLFVIFDIEVVFLYPWAVIAKSIGAFAFYEMAFFLFALLVGFAYIWRKKGLQWE